jgi:hypothetical protein
MPGAILAELANPLQVSGINSYARRDLRNRACSEVLDGVRPARA